MRWSMRCAVPTSAKRPDRLVDTSVAVALVSGDHPFHVATRHCLDGMTLGLSGLAAFETFSVLTRLPPPNRRSPDVISALMAANFPENRFLSPGAATLLLVGLPELGISGGSVYDALVAAAAKEHGHTLMTRDRRAVGTYQRVGVTFELLST